MINKEVFDAYTLPESDGIFREAAIHGNIAEMKRFINDAVYPTSLTDKKTSRAIVESNQVEVLKFYLEDAKLPFEGTEHLQDCFQLAVIRGHLEMVQYLVEKFELDISASKNNAVVSAAENNHVNILRYFVEDSGQKIDVTAPNNLPISMAASDGHSESLLYLVRDAGQFVDLQYDDYLVYRWAASAGAIDAIKFMIEDSGQTIDLMGTQHEALVMSVANRKSEVYTYLLEETDYVLTPEVYKKYLATDLPDNRYEILSEVSEKLEDFLEREDVSKAFMRAFRKSCIYGSMGAILKNDLHTSMSIETIEKIIETTVDGTSLSAPNTRTRV